MAENAAEVRNDALRDTTDAGISSGGRGQHFAFILTLFAFGAAVTFFAFGNDVAGLAFLSVPVLMLIKSFLPGSR